MKYVLIVCALLLGQLVVSQNHFLQPSSPFIYPNGRVSDAYFDIDLYMPNAWEINPKNIYGFYGFYYNKNGDKVPGFIKYSGSETKLKVINSGEYLNGKTLIAGKTCQGFLTPYDSVAVLNDLVFNKVTISKKLKEPQFAQFIGLVNGYEFFQHVRTTKDARWISYILKNVKTKEQITLPNEDEELRSALSMFYTLAPELEKMIGTKGFKTENIIEIYTYLKYKEYYNNDIIVYLNFGLNEVQDTTEAVYYLKVKSINTTVTELEYYSLDDKLVMDAFYSSLFFKTKHGRCTYYYPNGNIRKEVGYKDGRIKCVEKLYYEDGKPYMDILNFPSSYRSELENIIVADNFKTKIDRFINKIESTSNDAWNDGCEVMYYKVYDELGNSVLDKDGNAMIQWHDSISNRLYTYKINKYMLEEASYTEDGKTIYQFSNNPVKLRDYKINNGNFSNLFSYPATWQAKKLNGFCVIRIIISEEGVVDNIQIDRILRNEDKDALTGFLEKLLSSASWREAKLGKTSVVGEYVLMINFAESGSILSSGRYNNMGDIMMMNMQMQSMPKFTPRF
nr:hypothetical protein [uncultured Carboxylicivirga sp.]